MTILAALRAVLTVVRIPSLRVEFYFVLLRIESQKLATGILIDPREKESSGGFLETSKGSIC